MLRSLHAALRRYSNPRITRANQQVRRSRRLGLESLEPRQMLSINVVNGDFETGSLSGWTVGGPATTAAGISGYAPQSGSRIALLQTGQQDVPTTISQSFAANAGDVIAGYAFFKTTDNLFLDNDDAAVEIKSGNSTIATVFSSNVASVGPQGGTPWTPWQFTIPSAGTYTVSASVTNRQSPLFTSFLGLDVISLVQADGYTAQLASHAAGSSDATANNYSYVEQSALSQDGRYLAFVSAASNLVSGMQFTGGFENVFRLDRITGQIELVSVNADGTGAGNAHSNGPVISADGSTIAFTSSAGNLINIPASGPNIFARNLNTQTTYLVSVNSAGTASGDSFSNQMPSISADGHLVAFVSNASNLQSAVPDANNTQDIYVRDLTIGVTKLVSVNSAGTNSGNGDSFMPQISANGKVVVYTSLATNLTPLADANGAYDIFARNLATNTNTLVSVNSAGTAAGSGVGGPFSSLSPVINEDGTVVGFTSYATDLQSAVPDTNGSAQRDAYVRNLITGTTTLVSVNSSGTASGSGPGGAGVAGLSADGKTVAFSSEFVDLTDLPTNGTANAYVRNLTSSTTTLVSVNTDGTSAANGHSNVTGFSADGRVVAFSSGATNLTILPDGNGNQTDIFVRNLAANQTLNVSLNSAGSGTPNAHSRTLNSLSADGSVVSFASSASNIATHDSNNSQDVFVVSTNVTHPLLRVAVNSATWQIGTPFPQFTVSYDGFRPGDDPGVLGGSIAFSTIANQDSPVGTYMVSASGLTSNDYSIIYFDAVLTVTPAIVTVDLRPESLNIDQNGAISLVIFGSSLFDVLRVNMGSLKFAGVNVDAFNQTRSDVNGDGNADLTIHFKTSDALKSALTSMYSDLLLNDNSDDHSYSTRQDALIALDGVFGEFGQEFHGDDSTSLFLAGKSLKTLLASLGI